MDEYKATIHASLTEKILLAGVPREIAILNGAFGAAFVLYLHSISALFVTCVIHVAAVTLSKKDAMFFDVFSRHIKQKRFYE